MAQKCDAYRELLRITAGLRKKGFLKRFRTDLIKHDKRALRGYCGPYMWAVREGGTHLITPEIACYGTHHGAVWRGIAKGDYGKARVFYSPKGASPKRLSGATVGQVADRWERACPREKRRSLWD